MEFVMHLEDMYVSVIVLYNPKSGFEINYTYIPNSKSVTYLKNDFYEAQDFAIKLFKDKTIII